MANDKKSCRCGVDIGRSSVKVCFDNETFSFPNIIGEGKERTTINEVINPLVKINTNNIDIDFEEKRYWIGNLAKESFLPISNFEKSHINEYTKILLLSSLYLIPYNDFDVVVGLPLADFKKQKKELSNMLVGSYKINDKLINIESVSVFPQGVGALYSEYLSYSGRPSKDIPEKVGIIDIGYKDVNFAVLENGELNNKLSWSFPLGIHSAIMSALPDMDEDFLINEINPKNIPTNYYDRLQSQIENNINMYWKHRDFPVYSCGGGSNLVKIGDEQLKDNVYANAIGFRKLAELRYA